MNVYTNILENPLEIWEYGSGLDENINGYGYSKLSIKFPEIMAVAALVIYAPGVLGAIETIGAVISIFD